MGIEIEKKYRLSREERESLLSRLREVGAEFACEELEENIIYGGGSLNQGDRVLRLRRVGGRAILTYKERQPTASAIKRQREEETRVENADAIAAIFEALGYSPALVYEKRRATWRLNDVEVVLDELPFGLYLEIEGQEHAIIEAEKLLMLMNVEAEMATYPKLTEIYGEHRGGLIEARFDKSKD